MNAPDDPIAEVVREDARASDKDDRALEKAEEEEDPKKDDEASN